jgi:hypothetical protein
MNGERKNKGVNMKDLIPEHIDEMQNRAEVTGDLIHKLE